MLQTYKWKFAIMQNMKDHPLVGNFLFLRCIYEVIIPILAKDSVKKRPPDRMVNSQLFNRQRTIRLFTHMSFLNNGFSTFRCVFHKTQEYLRS